MKAEEIGDKVNHIPPSDEQKVAIGEMRQAGRVFLEDLDQIVPDSREKSLAVTRFEESLMWAMKGITHTE